MTLSATTDYILNPFHEVKDASFLSSELSNSKQESTAILTKIITSSFLVTSLETHKCISRFLTFTNPTKIKLTSTTSWQ
jgi:hypothetical protein